MEVTYYLAIAALALVSYAAGKLLAPLLTWIIGKFAAKTESTLDDSILDEVKGPVESFFFLFLFYAGVHLIPYFQSSVYIVEGYTAVAVTLVLTFLLFRITKAVFHWYYEEGHRSSHVKIELSLLPLLQKISQIFIVLLGLMAILSELKVDITGLVAFTSIIGIIAGLASQETIANLFAGLALQLDRIYHYGDYLRFSTGEVVRLRKIGMRSTKLYDNSGKMIIISNSEFAKMRLAKVGTPGNLTIGIPFEAPLEVDANVIEAHLKENLSKESMEGVHDIDRVTVSRLKIKAPGWYEGTVSIPVSDLSDYAPLIDRVNKLIIEEIENKGI